MGAGGQAGELTIVSWHCDCAPLTESARATGATNGIPVSVSAGEHRDLSALAVCVA